MACSSVKIGFPSFGTSPSFDYLNQKKVPALCGSSFIDVPEKSYGVSNSRRFSSKFVVKAQGSGSAILVPKSMRWWEKTLKTNMVEINSAQELVDELKNAGDRLVVVGFYSPACGGCKSLHPKVCQLAETNPDAIFLQINHEKLKPMCHALLVHVLPFFRFYRGSEGRLCSFSCTIATIKKFKDALAKYGGGEKKNFVGPAKGLEDTELMKLAKIGEIAPMKAPVPSFIEEENKIEELVLMGLDLSLNPLINFATSADDQVVGTNEAAVAGSGAAMLLA